MKDFVIVANAWGAGADNPTSKHRIALDLARRGHRVLWVEGAGMRAPSVGSGSDRARMLKKVLAALKGARRAEERLTVDRRPQTADQGEAAASDNLQSSISNLQSLWVLSPLFIPMPKVRLIRALNGVIGAWSARLWCWWLGFKEPVLINYVPVLAGVMRWWGGRVVYHCVDRWDAFKMYDSAVMAEMDRQCCEYADVVIASAAELRDRCLRWNPNTHLVTHGVDFEHFQKAVGISEQSTVNSEQSKTNTDKEGAQSSAPHKERSRAVHETPSTVYCSPFTVHWSPSDLPPGPIIGFFGLLSEWVDQALLLRLVREIPGAQLVLIGKADVDVAALKGVPAIHLLGPRPFSDLPAYLAHFTVGIIPFVVNDLTRSVNPIKLREMLSGGCPVVSTALPEVRAIEDCRLKSEDCRRTGVFVAEDDGEFVRMVAGLVEQPLSVDERRAVSAIMAGETWAGKVDEMLRIIGEVSGQ